MTLRAAATLKWNVFFKAGGIRLCKRQSRLRKFRQGRERHIKQQYPKLQKCLFTNKLSESGTKWENDKWPGSDFQSSQPLPSCGMYILLAGVRKPHGGNITSFGFQWIVRMGFLEFVNVANTGETVGEENKVIKCHGADWDYQIILNISTKVVFRNLVKQI